MTTGTIVRIMADKGFGFIKERGSGTQHFFHRSALRSGSFELLCESDSVHFDAVRAEKGSRAENVQAAG